MCLLNNIILSVVGYTILFSIAPLVSILIVRVMGLEEVGLLHRFGISYIPSFILTLLCLEFIGYWLQRASHSMPMLWSTTPYIITATKCTIEPQKTMPLGLTYFRELKYSRLDQLLLMPFLPKFANPTIQARRPKHIFYGSDDCA